MKMQVTDNNPNSYYGVTREFGVGEISINEFLGGSEDREDNRTVIALDFGKPYTERGGTIKSEYLGYSQFDVKEMIHNVVVDTMKSGSREDIVEEVIKRMNEDYICEITFRTYGKASGWNSHLNMSLVKKENRKYDEIATAEDIKPYLSEEEYDTEGTINNYAYYTNMNRYFGKKAVAYLVNKILKEEYRYCVKMGKNIIPDSYLVDGEAGIEAWKNLKSSKNKNNSIEKQMMKKLKFEKKQRAFVRFNDVIHAMLNEGVNRDWSLVFLMVDGRWATARRVKTINKFILNMSDDELLKLTDEEIDKRCKDYWVSELQQAVYRIKNMKDEQKQ